MDILFIHSNYPAQFRHLAVQLGQDPGHRVIFLTAREDAATTPLPGVEIRRYHCHRQPSPDGHHYLINTEEAVLQGQAILREVAALVEEGVRPRLMVTHGGMGLGLFLKDLLPKAVHVGYFEWYFRPETTRYLLASYDFDTQLKTGLRNLPILQELDRCDVAVVPTAWQKKQFPQAYQNKLQVNFDGVDRQFFHPAPEDLAGSDVTLTNRESGETCQLNAGRTVLSYATRGMEPLRGFPEFLRAAATLLEEFEDLEVVIAGADRQAYSYPAPSHGGSWKGHLLGELGPFAGRDRLHFTGLLSYADYRTLLWRSSLHCYFTRPYVTSWSLFEAAACGARLAVNRSPATEGIAAEHSVRWVDLEDQNQLTASLRQGLKQPGPRAELLPGFGLEDSLQNWQAIVNKALQSS